MTLNYFLPLSLSFFTLSLNTCAHFSPFSSLTLPLPLPTLWPGENLKLATLVFWCERVKLKTNKTLANFLALSIHHYTFYYLHRYSYILYYRYIKGFCYFKKRNFSRSGLLCSTISIHVCCLKKNYVPKQGFVVNNDIFKTVDSVIYICTNALIYIHVRSAPEPIHEKKEST